MTDKKEIVAGFIDWLSVGKRHFLVTLGLDSQGILHVLHLSEGPFNDFKTAHAHFEVLVQKGYEIHKPTLFVINGSTCLKYVVPGVLGTQVVLQRCQLRCVDQLSSSLPDDSAAEIEGKMLDYFELTYDTSMNKIQSASNKMLQHYPAVAANIIESSEETMTTCRLAVPMPLRLSLATTSMIWQQSESVLEEYKKVLDEASEEDLIDKMLQAVQKRTDSYSPLLGYEDLWLLETALNDELAVHSPDTKELDYRQILNASEPEENGSDPKKRRRHKRWKVSKVNGFIQHTIEAEILDIGMTGLAAQTNNPLGVGAVHSVRLQHSDGVIKLRGRVAWCRLVGSRKNEKNESQLIYHTGIEFEDTLTDSCKNIQFFFNKLVQINLDRRVFGRLHYQSDDMSGDSDDRIKQTPFKVIKVSLSGMLIETDFKPEKESLLQIEVRLGNQPFFSTGRVAYSETLKTGQFASRIGLEFVKIDDENQVILENFVKKQIRK